MLCLFVFVQRPSSQNPEPQQADAMEFLTFLLDGLHEELRQVLVSADRPPLSGTSPETLAQESEWEEVGRGGATTQVDRVSRMNAVLLNSSTVISRLFHGTIR